MAKLFLIFTFLLFLPVTAKARMLDIVDDYNKYSLVSSDSGFKISEDKRLQKDLNRIVSRINNVVNYKKYHSIIPRVIEGSPPCPNAFATTSNKNFLNKEKKPSCQKEIINLSLHKIY